jgi:hypothetical protein
MLPVYCISQEHHWLAHLQKEFPSVSIEVIPTAVAKSAFQPDPRRPADVLIADMDAVSGEPADQLSFVESALRSARYVIASVPKRLCSLVEPLETAGVHALQKPVTAGEITLAMNRAVRKLTSQG